MYTYFWGGWKIRETGDCRAHFGENSRANRCAPPLPAIGRAQFRIDMQSYHISERSGITGVNSEIARGSALLRDRENDIYFPGC